LAFSALVAFNVTNVVRPFAAEHRLR